MDSALPTYQLLIRLAEPALVRVGRLGRFEFPAGRYVYTGSARRNPEARIARHLSTVKRMHWHIDYLLEAPGAIVTGTLRFGEAECEINHRTPGRILVPGFGASDCRVGCGSHLKFLEEADPMAESRRFVPAKPEDAEALAIMALDIWRRCYRPDVLSDDEIDFFWRRTYRPEALREHMENGACYEWIETEGKRIGFLCHRVECDRNRLHLGKLYVLPEYHGQGMGAAALARVQALAVELGVRDIYLYVFRKNRKAVHAYLRAGFRVERAEVIEAGDGYCYDDLVMVWQVRPE